MLFSSSCGIMKKNAARGVTEMTEICGLCPRGCAVRRNERRGFCGEGETVRIGRASLHPWEEPPISGTRGSGTIFFSGCTLRCAFCQNRAISRDGVGGEISVEGLARLMLDLQERGAHRHEKCLHVLGFSTDVAKESGVVE